MKRLQNVVCFSIVLAFLCFAGCRIEKPQDTEGVQEASNAEALAADELFLKRVYRNQQGWVMPVRLHVPEPYDPGKRYPLILYLHGAGKRGTDNLSHLTGTDQWGSHIWITPEHEQDYPCFVLVPQCGSGRLWQNLGSADLSWELQSVLFIMQDVQGKYSIDPDRLYITGYSMGSYGT